jgi:hypothetical protein
MNRAFAAVTGVGWAQVPHGSLVVDGSSQTGEEPAVDIGAGPGVRWQHRRMWR